MAEIEKIETDSKRRITYYYHGEVGNFHYGPRHPMKPQRLAACTNLVVNYEIDKEMEMREANRVGKWEMERFHTPEYIKFLENISPHNAEQFENRFVDFCIGDDCPVFQGIFDFCSLYSGASLEGAVLLNNQASDIVINWSGGLHHAKKSEASGFCYVNDIVLAILELLKHYKRVLYIDIDIHHGDGVQEAFEFTDRVMTVSFHKYGDHFFPGTGNMYDIGHDHGRLFSVNVPFTQGIQDEGYLSVFKPVIQHVMDCFQPEAIVLQCGADSLGGDRLGNFNLSFDGHGDCVRFVRDFNVPLLVLGGGGYTLRNVARCWANETGILCGKRLKDDIPDTAEYMKFFEPEFTLRPTLEKRHEDQNTKEFLNSIREYVCENLRRVQGAPSVQMQPIPIDAFEKEEVLKKEEPDIDMHVDNSNDHLNTTYNGTATA